MATILRHEWLAPLAEKELGAALEDFKTYVPGTYVRNPKVACSPDSMIVFQSKKRAIQIIEIVRNPNAHLSLSLLC